MAVERVKVLGIKFFRGDIDGKGIDSGKIFVEESLDFTTGRAKGYAATLYSVGKAELAEQIMKENEFPMLADVEFMRVTNGDISKNIVVSFKPVAKPVPAERKAA